MYLLQVRECCCDNLDLLRLKLQFSFSGVFSPYTARIYLENVLYFTIFLCVIDHNANSILYNLLIYFSVDLGQALYLTHVFILRTNMQQALKLPPCQSSQYLLNNHYIIDSRILEYIFLVSRFYKDKNAILSIKRYIMISV